MLADNMPDIPPRRDRAHYLPNNVLSTHPDSSSAFRSGIAREIQVLKSLANPGVAIRQMSSPWSRSSFDTAA